MSNRVEVSMLQEVNDLLKLLETDPEVILLNLNQAVAKLIKFTENALPAQERTPDIHPGVWIRGDFDDILPREFWEGKL